MPEFRHGLLTCGAQRPIIIPLNKLEIVRDVLQGPETAAPGMCKRSLLRLFKLRLHNTVLSREKEVRKAHKSNQACDTYTKGTIVLSFQSNM
jgi:hypothetical protein